MSSWAKKNGFTLSTVAVTLFFGFVQWWFSWIIGPVVIGLFGAPFYFALIPVVGAILDVPAIHFVNLLLSKASVEYIDRDSTLALANSDGLIHKEQIKSLPVKRHIDVNLSTSFQTGAVRGVVFVPLSFALIVLAGYLAYYLQMVLHL